MFIIVYLIIFLRLIKELYLKSTSCELGILWDEE